MVILMCDLTIVLQAVLMVGMAQRATAAVIVCISLPVITWLDSALVVQDGKDSDATNVSKSDKFVQIRGSVVSESNCWFEGWWPSVNTVTAIMYIANQFTSHSLSLHPGV